MSIDRIPGTVEVCRDKGTKNGTKKWQDNFKNLLFQPAKFT